MELTRKLLSPQRKRFQKLLLAMLLVLVSLFAVVYVIQANNTTEQYLVATADLPAGSTFEESQTSTISVNLAESNQMYLRSGELPKGSYLLGPVRAGQLIARSMLASSIIDSRVPVVVQSDMDLPTGLVGGASVDLWVTPIDSENNFGEPFGLVLGAEVAKVLEKNTMFADAKPGVELWVPTEAVGPILQAQAAGSSISLILRPTFADG